MHEAKSVNTPFAAHFKLSSALSPTNETDMAYMARVPYSSAVGSLMYAMICTRPDLAYAVSMVEEAFTEEKPCHDQSVQIVASKEETEDKSVDSQEDQREKKGEKTEESATKTVESCSEIKQEEDTEEIKPSVEGGLQEKSYHNEGQILNAAPKDIPKEEEVEDIRIDPQEASEKCENGEKEEREQEAEESVDKFVQSCSETEQKEDTEEIKPRVETEEKTELITDDCITSQTEPHVVSAEHERKNDEAIQSEETVSEDTISEKAGYEEGLKLSDNSNIALKENEIGSKVEDEEKEQEDKSSDAQEASEEKVNTIVHEETSSEKVEYEEEVKHSDSSNVEINEKTLPILSKYEDLEWKQEGNTFEKDQGEDTHRGRYRTSEETILEKVESEEGLQFYDSSDIALNENEITYEEKEQEVYISGKGQGGEDDVTDATCKEILKEAEDKPSDAQEVIHVH
ncbi:unnamed protein product [Lactuca virosa]|uniref:Uncharacterized protein n=1 Tax=Lactuca virosa TaxID=75947 RepID=A0AAU9LYA5_9ASTR|nr:unnamed protein product [Lactuca virosa]